MKITLAQFRSLNMFKDIEQPELVYHMTTQAAAKQILRDGAVKTMEDFVCFFFPDLESIPVYIELTSADQGRNHYHFDGKIKKASPLNHNDMVILKLKPKGKIALSWYTEDTYSHAIANGETNSDKLKLLEIFDKCRICHFGNMKFYTDQVEIIPLNNVDDMFKENEMVAAIRRIKEKH